MGEFLQVVVIVSPLFRLIYHLTLISTYLTVSLKIDLCFNSLPMSGTTEFVVPVNRPVVAPESQLFVWLTVTVIGVAVFVAAVVLAVCVGILARYYHVQRKVTLSHHEFNTVPCKTAA